MAFNIDALLAPGNVRSKICDQAERIGQDQHVINPVPPSLPTAIDPFLSNFTAITPMSVFGAAAMMKTPSLAELQMLLGMGGRPTIIQFDTVCN
jgi:hypothetical protein